MKQTLISIVERLSAQVPALRGVDENWGQLDGYAPSPPVKLPCALVDVEGVQWSDLGDLRQTGAAQVRVTVATLRLSSASAAAPEAQRQRAFEVIDLLADVHRALHGWRPPGNASRLTRTATRMARRDDGIRQYEVLFALQLSDDGAQPQHAKASVTPLITA
jgi:hypothetical protein